MKNLAVLLPTLGTRPHYLEQLIESLQMDQRPFVSLVGPESEFLRSFLERGLVDDFITDLENIPLAEKIHQGFLRVPVHIEALTWIGDDDLFNAEGYQAALQKLFSSTEPSMVFGNCVYIDSKGQALFTNRPKSVSAQILLWGPQLISQPSTVYKRSAYIQIDGLSSLFTQAFDFDLFLQLQTVGSAIYINKTMSSWRWHPDSMTVKNRWTAVKEASQARKKANPRSLVRWVLDPFVRLATYWAGKAISMRIWLSRKKSTVDSKP